MPGVWSNLNQMCDLPCITSDIWQQRSPWYHTKIPLMFCPVWLKLHNTSVEQPSHHFRAFTKPGSQRGHRTSPRTLHTPSTHYSHCYHLADAIEVWKPEHPDIKTVFILRPSGCWMTRSHDNSVYLHYNHYLHYTQYCEQYLHCSNVYILYISHVFQCLCWMQTLHMQTFLSLIHLLISILCIFYIEYFCVFICCVSENLQIKNLSCLV